MFLDSLLRIKKSISSQNLINIYMYCQNNGINIYDLLGEMTCLEKYREITNLEIQILLADTAMVSEVYAMVIIGDMLIVARASKGAIGNALFVADFYLAACLAKKELDPCVTCTTEQESRDFLKRRSDELDQLLKDLMLQFSKLALDISSLAAQRAALLDELNKLRQEPCTWQ